MSTLSTPRRLNWGQFKQAALGLQNQKETEMSKKQNPTTLKVRKALLGNHNETALKVRKAADLKALTTTRSR
jgi:hypothetical protein